MNINDLTIRFGGKKAAILGASSSLLDDIKGLPLDCVLISVNHHAANFMPCDFVVFEDRHTNGLISDTSRAIRISTHRDLSEVDISNQQKHLYSSLTAAHFAFSIGCKPIILCGMDCFTDQNKPYFDSDEPLCERNKQFSVDYHLGRWERGVKNTPLEKVIVAKSGVLVSLFGEYNQNLEVGQ